MVYSKSNEMISLEDYLKTNKYNIGLSETMYVTYRCIGVYTMMYALMLNAPQDGAKELIEDIESLQTELIINAQELYNALTPNEAERDFENNLQISIMPMVENYQIEANKSWTNTGNYFNDYILSDSQICKTLLEIR